MSRSVPLIALILALVATTSVSTAKWERSSDIWSRVVMHDNGKRTESYQNINTRNLREETYDQNNIVVKKRLFQLDKLGRPVNALVFDGNDNVVGRVQYVYDEYETLKEERLFNVKGQLLRRLFYGLEKGGIQSKPIAFTYDPNNPDAKPMRNDKGAEPIMPLDIKTGEDSGLESSAPKKGIPGMKR